MADRRSQALSGVRVRRRTHLRNLSQGSVVISETRVKSVIADGGYASIGHQIEALPNRRSWRADKI